MSAEPDCSDVVNYLRETMGNGYGGMLLFGSSVEKTLNRPPRDYDVVVLGAAFNWLIAHKQFGTKKVELFVRPIDKLCEDILALRHYFDTRNMAAGKIMDPGVSGDLFPKIKRIAEVNWPKGPLRPRTSSHLFMRLKYENLRDEQKSRARDDVSRAFLQAWTLDNAISDFYKFYGLYLPKWSYLMGYLKVRDPIMHDHVVGYLLSRDLDDREKRLRMVVEHHLAPFGGYPPREWIVRSGVEYIREKDAETGEWKGWAIPDLEMIQPARDTYKIGLNEWVTGGQDFDFLGPEYDRDCKPIFYWDNSSNPPLPYVDATVQKVVRHYAAKPHIMGIIIFGSHGLAGRGGVSPKPDSDVDMYLVTERTGRILEKRFVDGIEFGLDFVNFTDVYRGILTRRNTSYWRNFVESTILFTRHPSIPFMVEIATMLFQIGMQPLSPDTVILYRKRLQHVLEDGNEMLEKGDVPSLLYNDNLLFCEVIRKWFRLHNWLDTKRTYMMKEIGEKDPYLFDLVSDYLLEWDPTRKHEVLHKIIVYVLAPYGGFLPEEWAVPLVPHEIRDEDLDEFLKEQGVTIPGGGGW